MFDEPTTDNLVAAISNGSFLSSANLAEIATKLVRRDAEELIEGVVATCNAAVVPLTEDIALMAGELEAIGRPLGLSLADRCCLATAAAFDATILTTDRAWLQLPEPWPSRIEIVRA